MLHKFPASQMFVGICVGIVSVLFVEYFMGAFFVNLDAPMMNIEGNFAPQSPHKASTGIGT